MTVYKEIEKDWYDQIYRSNGQFVSSRVRNDLLESSESYFCARLSSIADSAKLALEIGCGEGKHAILAATRGCQVIAVDISAEAIKIAQDKARQAGVEKLIEFRVADFDSLNFEGNSFDLIIDHETLSSLNPRGVLEVFYRLIKVDGVILGIECLGHNPIFNLNRWIKSLIGRRTKWAAGHILKLEDVKAPFKGSARIQVHFFHLFTVLLGPLWTFVPSKLEKKFLVLLQRLDQRLLKFPIKRYCFKVVFEITKC